MLSKRTSIWSTAFFTTLVLLAMSCAAAPEEADLGFGLGERADGLGCDPHEDLCWNSRDLDAMRDISFLQGELALDRGSPADTLVSIFDQVHRLEHKLTPEELDAYRGLYERALILDPAQAHQLASELDTELLYRLNNTFNATLMAEMGRFNDAESSDRADEGDPSTIRTVGLTPGMVESLNMLRDSSVLGRGYAMILESSGILNIDYDVVNAQNFGEWDSVNQRIVPTGHSREYKVDRIIRDYKRAAGFLGVATGAEALIPVAGVAISISHETYALFKLHARMTFEIAAVYGWDIRQGRNLFTVTTMLLTDGLAADTADSLISNGLVPLAANALARRVGIQLPQDMAKRLATRSIGTLFNMLKREGAEAVAKAATKAGAKALGKQLAGWVTFGAAVFVSGAVDWYVTDLLGEHIRLVAKNWSSDLMLEGTTYLSRPGPRDCFFQGLAQVAAADGAVTDRESALYQAFLDKPYNEDESSWIFLSATEKTRQLAVLDAAQSSSSTALKSCIASDFEDSLAQHKLSLLSYFYLMIQIDGDAISTERTLYGAYVDVLDGQGIFDGPAINESSLLYVERAVRLVIHPGEAEVPQEYRELMGTLIPEEMLDFLD